MHPLCNEPWEHRRLAINGARSFERSMDVRFARASPVQLTLQALEGSANASWNLEATRGLSALVNDRSLRLYKIYYIIYTRYLNVGVLLISVSYLKRLMATLLRDISLYAASRTSRRRASFHCSNIKSKFGARDPINRTVSVSNLYPDHIYFFLSIHTNFQEQSAQNCHCQLRCNV